MMLFQVKLKVNFFYYLQTESGGIFSKVHSGDLCKNFNGFRNFCPAGNKRPGRILDKNSLGRNHKNIDTGFYPVIV